jgi:hypothetical protein
MTSPNYSPEAKRQRELENGQALVVDSLITCDTALKHAHEIGQRDLPRTIKAAREIGDRDILRNVYHLRQCYSEILRELHHLRQCQADLRDWLAENMEAFAKDPT